MLDPTMRRESDHCHGERTGEGRRARDRILSGEITTSPVLPGDSDMSNRVAFLCDDLRESALALAGIETFLAHAQVVLEKPDLTAGDLRKLLGDTRNVERIELLWDALSSLLRSIDTIHDRLEQASTLSDERSVLRKSRAL